ncbi:MAG: rnc ribonuclease-3 [Fibrobacteres bacterium]|nr:rnc ribonuclease-3 [Fibrobacterota bacterium]
MVFGFLRKLFKGRRKEPSLSELERILGYRFQNNGILVTALSHRSYVNSQRTDKKIESNERMEFLGDAVLNIVVTDFLYHEYPDKEEGRMSKMKSLVVSSRVLGLCADTWKLGDFILLSRSEEKSGGRKRLSILADAYEAVIGAVYLDGGLESARKLIHSSLMSIMEEVLDDEELANYKSKLLEYTQSRGMGIPSYDVIQETGPEHQKSFVVGVYVQNQEWGRGSGNSKKSAEQAGARQALTNMDADKAKEKEKSPSKGAAVTPAPRDRASEDVQGPT